MTLTEALETIEKSQEEITDKVFLGEKPYPPDEYFVAVGEALQYLRCLDCMAKQAVKDNHRPFIPYCSADNFVSPELDASELPFG